MKYIVKFVKTLDVYVEADNKDEAEENAIEELMYGQYSEIDVDWKIKEVKKGE